MAEGRIIQEISLYDAVEYIRRRNRVAQKKFLTEVETVLGINGTEEVSKETIREFKEIRKLYLDSMNGFARDVVNDLYGGEIEK